MKRIPLLATAIVVSICFLLGCSLIKPISSVPTEEGTYICKRPTDIAINPNKLEIATVNIGKFTLGGIDYKSKPELVQILTEASRDQLIVDYLICIAKKRGDVNTPEQVDYLRRLLIFMQSEPSPDLTMKWQKENTFPSHAEKKREREIVEEARKRLRQEHGVIPDKALIKRTTLIDFSDIPNGVYGFIIPRENSKFEFRNEPYILNDYQIDWELHKLFDGYAYVIGFVSDDAADSIKNKQEPRNLWISLYSDQLVEAQEIVLIPYSDIISSKHVRDYFLVRGSVLIWDIQIK